MTDTDTSGGHTLPKRNSLFLAVGLVYLMVAAYISISSFQPKTFDTGRIILDAVWLDFWLLLSVGAILITWSFRLRRTLKIRSTVLFFSLFLFVITSVLLNGTPFSSNAYWGDQTFRQAMILKFMTFAVPGDFFYKGLPPFYPPAYFWILAMVGKILSLEAYKLMKVGSLAIYLFGPALLYVSWRSMVSRVQAMTITIASFLIFSTPYPMPLSGPHTFLGNVFFVPWWLYFMEGIGSHSRTASGWIIGGIIGAILFMVTPYPFAIGALSLLVRSLLLWTSAPTAIIGKRFSAPSAWTTAGFTALFSSIYWGPALLSILRFGSKPPDQEWFHLGRTGLQFAFLAGSLAAVLMCLGLVYSLRCARLPRSSGLLHLLSAATLFLTGGTLLGAISYPINVIKTADLMVAVGAAMVGLAVVGIVRIPGRTRLTRLALVGAVFVVGLYFVQDFNLFIRSSFIESARKSSRQRFEANPQVMENRAGAVFLCGNDKFPAFYPVYLFIANNQHYSHPASRFENRFRLLSLLQHVNDPHLFNLALRHNRFDRVRYFLPIEKEGAWEVPVALSTYPERFEHYGLSYSKKITENSELFVRQEAPTLFRVAEENPGERSSYVPPSPRDSALTAVKIDLVASYLTETGKSVLDSIFPEFRTVQQALYERAPAAVDDRILLLGAHGVSAGDSLHVVITFYCSADVHEPYKIFLHSYIAGQADSYVNHDFVPQRRSNRWKRGDIIICATVIPYPMTERKLDFGLFRGKDRLGPTFRGKFSPNLSDTHE